jgi:hypothetical protein
MVGEHGLALQCHQRARNLFRSIGDGWGEVEELNYIGDVYCDGGEQRKAASCYASSLEANVEAIRPSVSHSLEGTVTIAARAHAFRHVALLAGAINRIWNQTGRCESRLTAIGFEQACANARAFLGDSAFDNAWHDGAGMSLADAIEVGKSIALDFSVDAT